MKKKELVAYRKKEMKDLKKILFEKSKEAAEIYSASAAGQEKDTTAYRKKRHEIAQILTIIREKEIISDESKEQK